MVDRVVRFLTICQVGGRVREAKNIMKKAAIKVVPLKITIAIKRAKEFEKKMEKITSTVEKVFDDLDGALSEAYMLMHDKRYGPSSRWSAAERYRDDVSNMAEQLESRSRSFGSLCSSLWDEF